MRFGFTLVLFLLYSPSVLGQIVELQGGGSNFLGDGGGLIFYSPGQEFRFSAGILNGHFAYQASESFMYHDWTIVTGDSQFTLTGEQMSLAIPLRGMSAKKEFKKTSMTLFSGAVGDMFSSPFFFGVQHAHIGGGASLKRELSKGFTVGTIQEADIKRKTSLGEFEWRPDCGLGAPKPPLAGAGAFRNCWWKYLTIRGQAGLLQSNPQYGGNLTLATKHLGLSANRSTYIFNLTCAGCPAPVAPRVTTNSLSAYSGYGFVSGSASYFASTVNKGQAFNVGAHWSWFQVSASDYKSGKTSSQLLTFTEHNLHWNFSEYITRSNGTWNYNGGIGYQSNRFNFQIGYSVLYFPGLSQQQAFQKVLNISVGFRIRSASINGSTITQPTGKNQFMVGGNDYVNSHINVPAIPGGESTRILPSAGHGGRYRVSLHVVDEQGAGVEGASVVINHDVVFTDSQGRASIREKHKINSVMVDVNSFFSGTWTVIDAPQNNEAGKIIEIVVKRKP